MAYSTPQASGFIHPSRSLPEPTLHDGRAEFIQGGNSATKPCWKLITGNPSDAFPTPSVLNPTNLDQLQMDQGQEAFFQAVCNLIIVAARGKSVDETSIVDTPENVIPGEYINGWSTNRSSNCPHSSSVLVPVPDQPSLALVRFDGPEMNPVNSGWYDLVTPPTCQGSLALEDKRTKEWLCSGCRMTFRSKYEVKRHIDTAGMEVRCRYCDKVVNGTFFVLNRHVEESSRCLRKWEEQGFTGKRTVDGAFRA